MKCFKCKKPCVRVTGLDRCRACNEPVCVAHRMPESHECQGMGSMRAHLRDEHAKELIDPQATKLKSGHEHSSDGGCC